jgi:8-oxo-dGTP diphosphatase
MMTPAGNEHRPRQGVVAVIMRDSRYLVIRRSQHVRAPGAYCFPGGGVEAGEAEPEALRRELKEELSATARIHERLWQNSTPSGVELSWYAASLTPHSPLVANPLEVESIHWLTQAEILQLPGLLATNVDFLAAVTRGEVRLRPA